MEDFLEQVLKTSYLYVLRGKKGVAPKINSDEVLDMLQEALCKHIDKNDALNWIDRRNAE